MIKKTVYDALYDKRLKHIAQARHKVLTDYDVMNKIAKIVTSWHQLGLSAQGDVVLGRPIFRYHHPLKAVLNILPEARYGGAG